MTAHPLLCQIEITKRLSENYRGWDLFPKGPANGSRILGRSGFFILPAFTGRVGNASLPILRHPLTKTMPGGSLLDILADLREQRGLPPELFRQRLDRPERRRADEMLHPFDIMIDQIVVESEEF